METWNKSHAQVPVADVIDENRIRIYYATRDSFSRSRTSFIEVQANNPSKILYEHKKPILELGPLGSFDEHGIMPSSIISVGDQKYLFYIGWSLKKSVPYQNSIGLAISNDNGITFRKFSQGPIIGVNDIDPFFTGTIYILKESNHYKAYYLSCCKWELVDGRPEPFYILKYATSINAIYWKRENIVAIPFKNIKEGGLVSASVIKKDGKYFMWFGYRSFSNFRHNSNYSYKIGFAESFDGISWIRNDHHSGINISENGWDSEMISYPNIISINDENIMFYNGNGFGSTGFGYAILK